MSEVATGRLEDTKLSRLELEYLSQLGPLSPTLQQFTPDFLIISPAKTGTTWLSENLRIHRNVFIPEIKEVHYFNIYWTQFDLNWYVRHFQNSHAVQKRGEATPYAGLPQHIIRSIKTLFPHLKLIFLMRDPIQRAWSHAKHDYQYRQGIFASCESGFADVPEGKFVEHFTDVHSINSGDYLLCLQRWLSCFGRESIYVGFYESIQANPSDLMKQIFRHLEVDDNVNLDAFPLTERILPGLKSELPTTLKAVLRALYGEKTRELVTFLREEFGVSPPQAWADTLETEESGLRPLDLSYKGQEIFVGHGKVHACRPNFAALDQGAERIGCIIGDSVNEVKHYVDGHQYWPNREDFLVRVFRSFLDLRFSKPFVPVETYGGFFVILYQRWFYALELEHASGDFDWISENVLKEYQLRGLSVSAESLLKLHECIDRHLAPSLVLEGHRHFNVVRYRGRYYGFAQVLGHIDLFHLSSEALEQYDSMGQAIVASSLDEAKFLIDHINIASIPTVLFEDYRGFTIARYRCRYHGLASVLQVVMDTVKEEDLAAYMALGEYVVSDNLEMTKYLIDAISPNVRRKSRPSVPLSPASLEMATKVEAN
jgi:hypothetical protein